MVHCMVHCMVHSMVHYTVHSMVLHTVHSYAMRAHLCDEGDVGEIYVEELPQVLPLHLDHDEPPVLQRRPVHLRAARPVEVHDTTHHVMHCVMHHATHHVMHHVMHHAVHHVMHHAVHLRERGRGERYVVEVLEEDLQLVSKLVSK